MGVSPTSDERRRIFGFHSVRSYIKNGERGEAIAGSAAKNYDDNCSSSCAFLEEA